MSELTTAEQALITAYLQHELSEQEQQVFEQKIQSSEAFKLAVEQQKQLCEALPLGYQQDIDEQRLQSLRWQTQSAIARSANKKPASRRLSDLFNLSMPFKYQLAGMLLTFVLGYHFNSQSQDTTALPSIANNGSSDQIDTTPVSWLGSDNFEVTDLKIHDIDMATQTISFDYSLASTNRLSGSFNDKKIKAMLASALQNEVSDATRIDLVELSKHQNPSEKITEAVSYSLLNDPNPGVRMAAAETLGKIAHSQEVKQVLIAALRKETNPGIRVETFDALREYTADAEIYKLFNQLSQSDSNPYIKQQSAQMLKASKEI